MNRNVLASTFVLAVMVMACPSNPTPDAGAGDAARDAVTEATADAGCDAPNVMCGTQCADLQRSFQHCGSCGHRCQGFEICLRGACVRGGTCPTRCTGHEDCRACTYMGDPTAWCCEGGGGTPNRYCRVGGGTRCLSPDQQ